MIKAKQQLSTIEYQSTFIANGNKVKIGNYNFNVHVASEELDNDFLFNAFPDEYNKYLSTLSIEEQISNYRYIDEDICITFSKDENGNIIYNTPKQELENLWKKTKIIENDHFGVYRMQNVLIDKKGVVIGFSGESEFSIGYDVLYANKSVWNVWETSDNNGSGYKTSTHYLEVSLIRDPKTYKF